MSQKNTTQVEEDLRRIEEILDNVNPEEYEIDRQGDESYITVPRKENVNVFGQVLTQLELAGDIPYEVVDDEDNVIVINHDEERYADAIEPYDEFAAPRLRAEKKSVANDTHATINVPATGNIRLEPTELREMADMVEENPDNPMVKVVLREADPSEFVQALRETADWVEEVREKFGE